MVNGRGSSGVIGEGKMTAEGGWVQKLYDFCVVTPAGCLTDCLKVLH